MDVPEATSPSVPGLRERKKRETRKTIHRCALRLATERDPGSLTVVDICEAAMISTRTFFNYYPSKVAAILGLVPLGVSAGSGNQLRAADATSFATVLCEAVSLELHFHDVWDGTQAKAAELVQRWPELAPAGLAQLHALAVQLAALAAASIPPQHARLAAAAAATALAEAARARPPIPIKELPRRMREDLVKLGQVVAPNPADLASRGSLG